MIAWLIKLIKHPVVTLILGIIIGYFSDIWVERRKEFNRASDEFRKIFIQALADLRDDDTGTFFRVFSPATDWIKKHRVAYLNFRYYLRGECRNQYDDAWENYYCHFTWQSHFDEAVCKVLAKDIEILLEFPEYGLFKKITFLWEKYCSKFCPFKKRPKIVINKILNHSNKTDNV